MIPLEKSRRPERAVDRLAERSEASRINQLVIFHGQEKPDDDALDLKQRLLKSRPGWTSPTSSMTRSLPRHIGPEGLGLIVYEGVWR